MHDVLIEVLHEELLPALGCTEPIAVALAAAKARAVLGGTPDDVRIVVSGNIFKNARAVTIPNSGGRCGIPMAAALGVVAGDPDAGLECLAGVTEADIEAAATLAERVVVTVAAERTGLYVAAETRSGSSSAAAELIEDHSRFASVSKDGRELPTPPPADGTASAKRRDVETIPLQDILDFARDVDLSAHPDLVALLDRQIEHNGRVADEGLAAPYGAEVGRILAGGRSNPARLQARARAAAGADARMGGCALPVVINSGSGNQGLTVSLPVITYAEELGRSREYLHRALLVANLLAIAQKRRIGKLSAFCGASSAGSAAAAGVAWLKGMSDEDVLEVFTTSLATTAGMVCDGAKPSCAAKVSVAVEGGLTAVDLVEADRGLVPGAGLLGRTPDETVANMGRLAAEGMRRTDEVIVDVLRQSDGV